MTGSIDRFLSTRLRDGAFPGASWVVTVAGRGAACGGVGGAFPNVASGAVDEKSVFDLASLTKSLATAPLLVLAEQEGKLDLDDPLGRHIESLAHTGYASTSLLALASHVSGLPAWRPLYLAASTREGYLQEIGRSAPVGPPGQTLYSDLGYILLGAVVERVWDAGLDRLFEERIARPLGLDCCGFATSRRSFAQALPTERGNAYERELAGETAAGFEWREEIPGGQVHDANAHGLGGVAGHAGLFGSAVEVARIAAALSVESPLGLGSRARSRLLDVVPGSAGRTVGMVAASHASAARGILPASAVGHTGFTGTSFWLDPLAGAVYVLLTNRVHPRVPRREFRWTRRAFHRLARCLVRASV